MLIGNLNGDAQVNNADIQALIGMLANNAAGGSSIAAVPEPPSVALAVIAFALLSLNRKRQTIPPIG